MLAWANSVSSHISTEHNTQHASSTSSHLQPHKVTMVAAVENPFDQLQSCSQDTRRKGFLQLWREGQIKQNGFTLYQYHVFRPFAKSSGHYMKAQYHCIMQRSVRWSYTTEQQENFSRRQTQELLRGSIMPLQPETFETYLQGRYDCSVKRPSEPSFDAQRYDGQVNTSGSDALLHIAEVCPVT
ncbi:hypothetical protein AC579_6872 [Pseudocercospora musae]|uniref:Uncharacterized protein n=1 Tax=Pseudocercospora musae TaxID=113226 RepID=A0A139HL82_9PEZI|nr:hypothetical protein AC579_6872 [Pseudocercospora musae]